MGRLYDLARVPDVERAATLAELRGIAAVPAPGWIQRATEIAMARGV